MSSRDAVAPILPGATLGVLGSGQLGRMFALAAKSMGYRVHVFSPQADTPAGQVADVEFVGRYEDADALRRFAETVSAVTVEFENIPVPALELLAEWVPVRPGASVLAIAQHRLREKNFLSQHGLPVAAYRPIQSRGELQAGVAALGTPCILKTAGFGYDGKGQVKITDAAQVEALWPEGQVTEHVLEAFVAFEKEVSVIVARGVDGAVVCYDVIENQHQRHILDVSCAPAALPPAVAQEAQAIARQVAEALDLVGVLCVEFFCLTDGGLVINELAPRPHNSGHLTLEAAVTSQFEQQVRALCALPLGDPRLITPAAMVNLLGDLWPTEGAPRWEEALRAHPALKLHLYGKDSALPGRKMGHLTLSAATVEAAVTALQAARQCLIQE